MLHSELIKTIIESYQDEYKEFPAENKEQQAFREGMLFAYRYLLVLLENPDDIPVIYHNYLKKERKNDDEI